MSKSRKNPPETSPPPRQPEPADAAGEDLLHQLRTHQIELEMQNEALRQAQEDLELSRNRYFDLYEFAPVGYLTLTGDGLIAEANLTAASLLGVERRKLLKRRFVSFVLTQDRERWERLFLRAMRDSGKQSGNLRLRCADGLPVDVNVDCLRTNGDGAAPRLRLVLTDVTELTRQSRLLLLFSRIFDESPLSIVITDADGRIEYVNPFTEKVSGFSADELIGRDASIFSGGETPDEIHAAMWADLRAGEVWTGEFRNKRKSGDYFWETASIFPVTTDEGAAIHYVAIREDITERKRTGEKLRESEERLRLALEAANQGWFDVDLRTGKVSVSPEYVRMIGFDAEDFATDLPTWLSQVHADDRPKLAEAFRACVEYGGPGRMEYRRRAKSGEWKWICSIAKIVEWDDRRQALRMVGIHTDISEHKALELSLKQTNADLEQFAYVASHDLRQPLRMVTSYLRVIEKSLGPQLGAELKTCLDFAVDGARRMDGLISDLLQFSRTGVATETAPVPLGEAVAEALAILAVTIRDSGASVRVASRFPTVTGNRVELVRLFQNLVTNAVTYRAPDRAPEVEIDWRPQASGVLVWVKDNGMGIAPEHYERAFKVFQRLVPRDAFEGSGIGLSICKKIIEHHGGTIWIDSELGAGSSFLMTFPMPAASAGAPRA